MFIKIEHGETTVCYTANRYMFSWKGDIPAPMPDTEAAISIYQDDHLIIDYALPKFSSVYVMNDQGKTIDTFRVS